VIRGRIEFVDEEDYMRTHVIAVLVVAALGVTLGGQPAEPRPRARDLGLAPGVFTPGPLNAITDVEGVRVGQVTLSTGDTIRTGVTAVVPHGGNVFQDKVPGAVFVGNAFGKLAGSTQVDELGTIETPIVLTNTLAVGAAVEGVVRWTLTQPGNADVRSVNAVVGETNDAGLNDIRALAVRPDHVVEAIGTARTGAVEEGSVGAGTGTQAFGWKGGIGTASRRLEPTHGGYTVGVLVQTNYGGVLTMGGAPIGRELGRYAYAPSSRAGDGGDGSCMVVVATDAPLDARDLKRLAARAIFALARTGSSFSNGSGDFAIAFSTHPSLRSAFNARVAVARTVLPTDGVSPLFQAALEATEESVYNSLLRATTTTSRGTTVEALPIDRVRAVLQKYNVAGR
jgi:D-aminopeptidase